MSQVDDALLTHPDVREAVAFAAPDEKFGEAVAAVVVLNSQPADAAKTIADIKRHVGQRISRFKVRSLPDDSVPRFQCVAGLQDNSPANLLTMRFSSLPEHVCLLLKRTHQVESGCG